MNPKSYSKKCNYGHFESDHVNLNKKFYDLNTISETGMYIHPPPTIDNPKTIKCRGSLVTNSVQKRKVGCFGDNRGVKLNSFHFCQWCNV